MHGTHAANLCSILEQIEKQLKRIAIAIEPIAVDIVAKKMTEEKEEVKKDASGWNNIQYVPNYDLLNNQYAIPPQQPSVGDIRVTSDM